MNRSWLPTSSVENSSSQNLNANVHQNSGTNSNDAAADLDDWNKSTSFVSKPIRGWLHSDQKISDGGICYGVRYIGCLEVNTSMKSLAFETRSLIAKECINKLCEAAGLKTVDKKRKVDKRLLKMLAEKPNMDFAGSNVSLTINSSSLNLVSMETREVIAYHEMPKISFASGGDADTLDFVSYVAKDNRYGRACFVLECGGGLAQNVITTIGQAFELRYKQFLKRTPRSESELSSLSAQNGNSIPSRDDPEYYNDLPGKVPPDVIVNATFLDNDSVTSGSQTSLFMKEANSNFAAVSAPHSMFPHTELDSLIDLTVNSPNISVYRRPGPEYVNTTAVISNERLNENFTKPKTVKPDIFDMQPFAASLPILETTSDCEALIKINEPSPKEDILLQEVWFHGPISRQESEALVVKDGDFLVRESQSTAGQYVLTGMERSLRKHLLLVDPEGVIRTKDQVFDSISHLIQHHRDNCLPIISGESALLLRSPVGRKRPLGKAIQV